MSQSRIILAILAMGMATPAFADGQTTDTETASFTQRVAEDCTFTSTIPAVELDEADLIGAGTLQQNFTIDYECNTEFRLTTTTPDPLINQNAVEFSADYTDRVLVASTFIAAGNGSAFTSDNNGTYQADDGQALGSITFTRSSKPLTAGDYSTAITVNIVGDEFGTQGTP